MSLLGKATVIVISGLLGATVAQAGPVKADGWVTTPRGQVRVQFAVYGPCKSFPFGNPGTCVGVLNLRSADHPKPEMVRLRYPETILTLLADKRMEFMWQPLTEWAGPTLETLRDRTLAQLRDAYSSGSPMLVFDPPTDTYLGARAQALVDLTDYMMMVGQSAPAEQLLRDYLSRRSPRTDDSAKALEWEIIAMRAAEARLYQGDPAGAITEYAKIESALGDSPYAVNAAAARAALLARTGHYAEALSAIEKATEQTSVVDPKSKAQAAPTRNRQLTWIKACALHGLGRTAEAQTALETLRDTYNADNGHTLDTQTDTIEWEAAVCTGDASALKKMIVSDLRDDPIPRTALPLQPGYNYVRDKALLDAVRSDPDVQKLANERMRTLPAELTNALNWGPVTP